MKKINKKIVEIILVLVAGTTILSVDVTVIVNNYHINN